MQRENAISIIFVKKKYKKVYISSGKDSKRYRSFTKANKVVFTIANDSVYTSFS